MTNEQREAIEELKSLSPSEGAIEMILSLIKEQQIYIKKYNDTTEEMNRDIRKLISEIEKKDKQKDLMARAFKQDDARTVEEIKQYFADLARKEKIEYADTERNII